MNIVPTIGKIAAGTVGRSAAMVADGIHSLSDLSSDIVVLVFTHISSKGKDDNHCKCLETSLPEDVENEIKVTALSVKDAK